MPCLVTGREGVRGQDKHEKRRSGDLPIVAPPIPSRRGDATLTNVSSSASGPYPTKYCMYARSEVVLRRREILRNEGPNYPQHWTLELSIRCQTCVDDSNAVRLMCALHC
jgi:hypothetical protein